MPWVLPRSWRVEFEGNLVALSRARAGDVEVAVNTSSGRCRRCQPARKDDSDGACGDGTIQRLLHDDSFVSVSVGGAVNGDRIAQPLLVLMLFVWLGTCNVGIVCDADVIDGA